MIEKWRDVVNYEGLYQASNLGKVKSLNYNGTKKERILLEGKSGGGYRMVVLYKNKKKKAFMVHRLVYQAFMGVVPQGFQLDHADNNPGNNRLDNLQLLTPSENSKKKFIDNPQLRYNKATKIKCLNNGKIYNSQSQASRELNLHCGSINRVLKEKCKQTVGYTFEYVGNYKNNGGSPRKIICLNDNKIYESISQASRILNLNRGSIHKVLKGTIKRAGGYSFAYIDEQTEDKQIGI